MGKYTVRDLDFEENPYFKNILDKIRGQQLEVFDKKMIQQL
jgi:hypothetical protein